MKKNHFNKSVFLSGALAFVLALSGCQDKSSTNEVTVGRNEQKELAAAKALLKRLPDFQVVDKETGRMLRVADGGFEFTEPGDGGWNFSSPTGATYTNTGTGGTFTVASSSFEQNSAAGGGSGTIQVGNSSLPVNYTFCFSAGEEFFGGDLFLNGNEDVDGISGVIGVSGDFEAMQNADPNDNVDFEEIFKGMGMYIVYAKQASGSYKILNWIDLMENSDDNEEPTADDLKNKGFAFFIDFVNKKIYFSYNGDLNVSGGNMTFTGKYLEVIGSEDDNDMTVRIVDGLGTMGCN